MDAIRGGGRPYHLKTWPTVQKRQHSTSRWWSGDVPYDLSMLSSVFHGVVPFLSNCLEVVGVKSVLRPNRRPKSYVHNVLYGVNSPHFCPMLCNLEPLCFLWKWWRVALALRKRRILHQPPQSESLGLFQRRRMLNGIQ